MLEPYLTRAKLCIVSKKESLADCRAFFKGRIDILPVDTTTKNKILLTLDEACANAIIHGNCCDENQFVTIDFTAYKNKLEITIKDNGSMLVNTSEHLDKTMESVIKNKQKGGMGLKLMHSIMDDIVYFSEEKRNICKMTKAY